MFGVLWRRRRGRLRGKRLTGENSLQQISSEGGDGYHSSVISLFSCTRLWLITLLSFTNFLSVIGLESHRGFIPLASVTSSKNHSWHQPHHFWRPVLSESLFKRGRGCFRLHCLQKRCVCCVPGPLLHGFGQFWGLSWDRCAYGEMSWRLIHFIITLSTAQGRLPCRLTHFSLSFQFPFWGYRVSSMRLRHTFISIYQHLPPPTRQLTRTHTHILIC